MIILQRKALRIINFKEQLFHSSPLFSSNNVLKFGEKITLGKIIFVSKSINTQVCSIFNDWFTFSGNYIGMKLAGRQLTILIFQLFESKNMVILVSEQLLHALGTIHKIFYFLFKFSSVYQQCKISQRSSWILRAIPLVLVLLSRNCPLRKKIK